MTILFSGFIRLTDIIETDTYPHITNILAKIKGRCISTDLLDESGHLIYAELDPVLYVGDSSKQVYRYTQKGTMNVSKSFLEK